MAIYKGGENWRAVYRYTDGQAKENKHKNEGLKPNVKLRLGSVKSLLKQKRILI